MLLPLAKRLIADYECLCAEADGLNGLKTGLIRIGTFSSVATHWLPNIIKEFRKKYPGIEYELLLGDYREIEKWIEEGRVDCGFLRLPANSEFETAFLEQDRLMAILPCGHPLEKNNKISVSSLCTEPFIMLGKEGMSDAAEIFEKCGLTPDIKLTTWDDYAVMSMVESGLGVSILPQLILKRIPYRIAVKELETPFYRNIALAIKDKKTASPAVKRFLEFLNFRNA